jgi:ubiquinone/menaquinone biosynthesis C-methylase UbiE
VLPAEPKAELERHQGRSEYEVKMRTFITMQGLFCKVIRLDKLYFSKEPRKKYLFAYDKRSWKRPVWLEFKQRPDDLQFVKILIDGEAFWYRYIFGSYFIVLEATHEDIEIFYDALAKQYDKMLPQNRHIGEFFGKKLHNYNSSADTRILELCAGTGVVSQSIFKHGFTNLTLLDISAKSLEIAKRKIPSCKTIKANVLKFNTRKRYDVIFESMGLDSFDTEELTNILHKVNNWLNEGGIFLAVDRHIFPPFERAFTKLEKGYFFLDTPIGKYRYDYFIGKKKTLPD